MARSVADAATIPTVIAGKDPLDNFTLAQPPDVPDYTQALNKNALKGVRLGVARQFAGNNAVVLTAFNASLEVMRGLGATIVDPADFPDFAEIRASGNETIVLDTDFKVSKVPSIVLRLLNFFIQVDVNNYIAGLLEVPTGVKNLADLIAFNSAHADQELPPPFWTDQST